MQVLTVKDVVDGVNKAIANDTLLALHPEKSGGSCFYEVGSYRCSIGTALTRETLLEVARAGIMELSLESLVGHRLVQVDNKKHLEWMCDLQWAHDQWLMEDFEAPLCSERFHQFFLEILSKAPIEG